MTTTESIPQIWNNERDDQFFRITASLFTPTFTYGASVLLATYDTDELDPTSAVSASSSAAPALVAPAAHDLAADTSIGR